MPRYRRARRRSGPTSLSEKIFGQVFVLSWAISFLAAVFYWLRPSIEAPEDQRGIAIIIFFSPLFIFELLLISWFVIKYSPIIILIWGPLGVIAAIYIHLTPPSDHRDGVVLQILASPFILALLYLGCVFYGVLAWFALILVQNIFYACLWWRWVLCRPRFRRLNPFARGHDPFAQTQLCDECKEMLSQSGLLFGRWTFLTRAQESYPYTPRTQEISSRVQPLCHLCVLMAKEFERLVSTTGFRDVRNSYGTFSLTPRQPIDCETADAVIRISTAKWGLSMDSLSYDPDCHLQMFGAEDRCARMFRINQGPPRETGDLFSSTGSDKSMRIIKHWLKTCSQHRLCSASPGISFVPTRLVRVGKVGEQICHLAEKSGLGEQHLQYFALSHCWGHDVEVVLTAASVAQMLCGIEIQKLSKNFQDAIWITRALGAEYIWIDSLCIIQDSPEDWNRESVLMMDVFANAACTISATASSSSQGGCLREWFNTSASCQLVASPRAALHLSGGQPSHQPIKTLFDTRVENSPLNRRAWAFQERLLSRRIIHFCSDMLLFECNTIKASELDIHGSKYEEAPYVMVQGRIHDSSLISRLRNSRNATATGQDRTRVDIADGDLSRELREQLAGTDFEDHTATRGIRGALDTLLSINTQESLTLWEKLEFNQRWYELVNAYSGGELTHPTDKLIAIAGIADIIAQKSNAKYVAGMWSNMSPEFGLLWQASRVGKRQSMYCAPSWSWASINGRINLLPNVRINEGDVTFHAHVQRAHVEFMGQPVDRAASHVDAGYLDIAGPTLKVACSSTQPSKLEYWDGKERGNLTFYPDCEQDLEEDSVNPFYRFDRNLTALFVLSTTGSSNRSFLQIQGLVLKPKGEEIGDFNEFERVGVFQAQHVPSAAATQWLAEWKQQIVRIV